MTGRYRRWDGGPTRTCSRCSEPRPLAEFRRDSRGYVRSHCRPCALAVTQEWRARNRDRLLPERRARYAARRADPGGEIKEGAASAGRSCARVPTPAAAPGTRG